jgi:hypothetical protein
MPNRIERLRQYANPRSKENWRGAGRDQKNIDRFSERATENSELAPRASGKPNNGVPERETDPPELHNTGKVKLRSTATPPRRDREIDRHMAGEDDPNHVGSGYMPGVRREA